MHYHAIAVKLKMAKVPKLSAASKVEWFAILKNRAHIGGTPYYKISKLCFLFV